MSLSNIAIVVPTIRSESIKTFLNAWKTEFSKCTIYIVEDNPRPTCDILRKANTNIKHYTWKDIDNDLGNDSWIIPRRTDCVRSYGFYSAFKDGADVIISMDDDCLPPSDMASGSFIRGHINNLTKKSLPGERSNAWISTIEGLKPRGIPFGTKNRDYNFMISHGLWLNVPDLDAITQLRLHNNHAELSSLYRNIDQAIPRGMFYPMCGMNVAFRAEITPIMYFLLMGKDYPYDRFGDIWCGLFSKKILDKFEYDVFSGNPAVLHKRASDPWVNLHKEEPGYLIHENLWKIVNDCLILGDTYGNAYRNLASIIGQLDGDYFSRLSSAMELWVNLCEQ